MTRFVEGRGVNVSYAGERCHFDGFGGCHRVPGIRAGPDGGNGEAVSGIDEGSRGHLNVYDVRGEREPDEDAGNGVFGGREQGFGDRDGERGRYRGVSRGGNGVGGRFELFHEDPGIEGRCLGDSAGEHRGEHEPAGAGAV